MKRKRVMPWKLRRQDQLQRIGQAGARRDALAALFAVPRQAAQEGAGDALAGTAIDGASLAAQRAAGADG